MSLADTGKAIGAVSSLLQAYLTARLSGTVGHVHVGRAEVSGTGITNPRLNLFLYEVQFEPNLRDVVLDQGQPAPLWLVLKYVLTAFDENGDSDSSIAHQFLGEGMRVLQELSYLPLSSLMPTTLAALKDNPEVLKITFDPTSADLISKLMQGPDDKYRCSIGFEVRPVMIATSEPSSYALLVGVDYETNTVIGEQGIQIPVLPSLGPTIVQVSPSKLEITPTSLPTLTIQGEDLNLSGLVVQLGTVDLPLTAQTPVAVQCVLNGAIRSGRSLSAGSQPLAVVQVLPTGRRRSSNLLVVDLLPFLDTVTASGVTRQNPGDPNSQVYGTLTLTGLLLGSDRDDIFLALYRNGRTVKVFDTAVPVPSTLPAAPTPWQTQLQLTMQSANAVPPGNYRVILRVNGQQARNSPEVSLVGGP